MSRAAVVVGVVAVVMTACSRTSGGGATDADIIGDADETADDSATDDLDDSGDDAPDPRTALPHLPPPAVDATRIVDAPYYQEYNSNPLDLPLKGETLVGVLHPAAGDVPVYVGLRGFFVPQAGGAPRRIDIGDGEPDLTFAASTPGLRVAASAGYLYRLEADGRLSVLGSRDVPIEGLIAAAEGDRVWVKRGGFVHPVAPTGDLGWAASGAPTDALYDSPSIRIRVTGAGARIVSNLGDPPQTTDGPAATLPDALAGRVHTVVRLPDRRFAFVAPDAVAAAVLDGNALRFTNDDLFAANRLPYGRLTGAGNAPGGDLLVWGALGAARLMYRDDAVGLEWRVYNHERWIPGPVVTGALVHPVAADARLSPLHFATRAGPSRVTTKWETLEQKLVAFVDRIVKRHDRDGAVADSRMTAKGDLTTNIPWDSDNDGGWTHYWLLAECHRWKVTGAADARANFDKALQAMLNLRLLSGMKHFIARAVIRIEGCKLDDCDNPDDGEWFKSPDGKWWVKGDTSNDEIIAHWSMMGHAYDLCATEPQRDAIREHIRDVTAGIVDNGFQLLDRDGKVTTYGQWDPVYVNENFQGRFGDGGGRSAQMLGGLNLAWYMTGEARFSDAKRYLIEQHGYADNAEREATYPSRRGNGDGNEMGNWAWMLLLRYEPDPDLRERWKRGATSAWDEVKVHEAAWWDVQRAVSGFTDFRPELALRRWLRLAPVDMIRWDMTNSTRNDLAEVPLPRYGTGRMRSDGHILPYDERRNDRWNTDQFRVDGGMGGTYEMDGADVLAPYWMARYYGWIVPAAASGRRSGATAAVARPYW